MVCTALQKVSDCVVVVRICVLSLKFNQFHCWWFFRFVLILLIIGKQVCVVAAAFVSVFGAI